MSELCKVSYLFGTHAGEIEKARDIFTAETQNYVTGLLHGLGTKRKTGGDGGRVAITFAHDCETEGKKTGYFSKQFAKGRGQVGFKFDQQFATVGNVVFGFKFIPDDDQFCWYVAFTPSSRYPALDNRVARAWENAPEHGNRPGFRHLATETKVQFVSRTLADGLPATTAKEDVDAVMKFLFGTESEIAKFGGAEPSASAPSAGA